MAGGGAVSVRGVRGRWRVAMTLAWLLATLLTAFGTPAPVAAAAFVVTAGADTADGTCNVAHCSLREAITAAEANPDADTITFAPGLTAIVLDSALPTITRSLTIQGSGTGGVTIRRNDAGGTPNFRILRLSNTVSPAPTPPVAVALTGLTLANGRLADGSAGAGILNSGVALTMTDSAIAGGTNETGNGGGYFQAGFAPPIQRTTAVFLRTTIRDNVVDGGDGGGFYLASGDLTLTDSIVSGNTVSFGVGGGLYVAGGTATLTNSAVGPGNSAGNGGGIGVAGGELTVDTTAVAGNSTPGGGGGLRVDGGTATLTNGSITGNEAQGYGAVDVRGGTVNLTNMTLSDNSATLSAGAVGVSGGTATLAFVTATGNRTQYGDYGGAGALATDDAGTLNLAASIVAGNTVAGVASDCAGAAITSLGSNVVGVGCPSGNTLDLAYTGDLAALLNPTLADNGGPTQTHALPLGSPALDRPPLAACAAAPPTGAGNLDQRGVVRPQPTGGACDSGAFELAYHPLTVVVAGGLGVGRTPPGGGGGPFGYLPGTVVTLTPVAGDGQTFTGWVVDGVAKGWAPELTITMDAAHTVQATFAPTKTFADTGSSLPEYAAVVALATRGYILGLSAQEYGPGQGVQRAQMAALISRATPAGPDTPPKTAVCVVPNSWDCEDWGNSFQDRGGLIESLWRNAGTLQHYKVAFGYDGPACAARNVPSPCYAPGAPVTHAETIAFITRAMQAKGYWVAQPNAPLPDPSVPGVLATEAKTYAFYTGSLLAPPPGTGWNDGATRGWFARALWQALNSYWGTDAPLADGRPAGGMVP